MSQSQPPVAVTEQAPGRFEPQPPGHNLPVTPTPLIGRERELAALGEMLRRPEVRLLTFTGAPGIGKTRLAVQAAANAAGDFADGVRFVPLAPISDPALVISAITQALQVREESSRSLLEVLRSYLETKQMLLLLDNFEQVVEAAPLIGDLLYGCPGLKVLVTSRELLRLYGEHDYPVPALSLPSIRDTDGAPGPDELAQFEAVNLFVQRAQQASPGFQLTQDNAATVAAICTRLDGLALAIELAAARILVLEPEELLSRLDHRLKLLTGGPRNLPERQRTLRATIDWSYRLLEPDEQAMFRRLGVFVGGCTLQAIEEVCAVGELGGPEMDALNVVSSLIGKSLLRRQEAPKTGTATGRNQAGGEMRFMMLETIREYAREKLVESGELDLINDRHFEYFVRLAEDAEEGSKGTEMALWMRRLDADLNNMRAALEWSLTDEERAEKGLRMVGALVGYWDDRGYFSEGRQWCAQLLSKTEPGKPSAERSRAMRGVARMMYQLGELKEPRAIYEKSLEMSRGLDDEEGVVSALSGLGSAVMWQGEYDYSLSLFEETLVIGRRLGSKEIISNALSMIGVMHMRKEDYRAAEASMDQALAIERELGNDALLAVTLAQRASVAIHLGEYEQAKALIEESLGLAREIGLDWVIAFCLARLGLIALLEGEPQRAEPYFLEGLDRARESGLRRWTPWYLIGLAEVSRLGGMAQRAAKLIGASQGSAGGVSSHYEPATRDEIERITASVRAELDEEAYERLLAEGQGMSLGEAMAFAGSPVQAAAGPPAPVAGAVAAERRTQGADELTEREVEVLRLIAVGKSNQEIGQELTLSRRTVERHISNIYEKIGASGKVARATATAFALRHGYVT